MILYHGTTESRGRQILSEGKIKRTTHEAATYNSDIKVSYQGETLSAKTTCGFVYLTDKVLVAATYGVRASIIHREKAVYIFKINVDESLLEIDTDEIKNTPAQQRAFLKPALTPQEALAVVYSTCVSFDILLSNSDASYTILSRVDDKNLIADIMTVAENCHRRPLSAYQQNIYQQHLTHFSQGFIWADYCATQ